MQLEVAKAVIEAEKDARVAAAQAMGQALSRANRKVWGDPESVKKMSESLLRGQQVGSRLDRVASNMPDPVRSPVGSARARLTEAKGEGTESGPKPSKELTEPEKSAWLDEVLTGNVPLGTFLFFVEQFTGVVRLSIGVHYRLRKCR